MSKTDTNLDDKPSIFALKMLSEMFKTSGILLIGTALFSLGALLGSYISSLTYPTNYLNIRLDSKPPFIIPILGTVFTIPLLIGAWLFRISGAIIHYQKDKLSPTARDFTERIDLIELQRKKGVISEKFARQEIRTAVRNFADEKRLLLQKEEKQSTT